MEKLIVSKDFGYTKVRDAIKASVSEALIEMCADRFEGEAGFTRVKSGDTENTEIAFLVATVTENGVDYPVYCKLNPVIAGWVDRPYGKGKIRPAYDYTAAHAKYDKYMAEKPKKEAENARKKAEKIEKDTARRKAEKAVQAETE